MRRIALMTVTTAALAALPLQAQKPADLDKAAEAKATMLGKDPGMAKWFDGAYGYAMFPNVGKGGMGIGGAHGNGTVFREGSPVGKAELLQVTVGFQLGGQSFIEVIFFKDKTALDDFTRGNFEFGAEASAVAFTAEASAKLAYNGGVAIITMAKGGLMYEASIGGQKFNYTPF